MKLFAVSVFQDIFAENHRSALISPAIIKKIIK